MTSDGRRSSASFAAPPASGNGNDGKRRSMPWETPISPEAARTAGEGAANFAQIKTRVHRRILERLNLSNLDKLERDEVVSAIAKVVQDLVAQEQLPLNLGEREQLVRQVVDEILGLGPLEELMQEREVADILVYAEVDVRLERVG